MSLMTAAAAAISRVFSGPGQRAVLSGEETARQLLYLVRAHYACTDASADGRTRCPLYYGSIEGILGSRWNTVARLKGLPVPGAPADFRMVDLFNVVPKAVRTDLSCMLNGFSWDRLQVKVNGEADDARSKILRQVFRESEKRESWTLQGLLFSGAGRGDSYTRIKPDPSYRSKVALHLAMPEGVFPRLKAWNTKVADSYRLICQIVEDVPANVAALKAGALPAKTYVEILTSEGVEVYEDDKLVEQAEDGTPVSGPNPTGLDEPAMVHIAYRDSGEFYGIPSADSDQIDLIDEGNIQAASLKQVGMSYGQPNLVLKGASQDQAEKTFRWGRRGVLGLPVDGDAKFLGYDNLEQFLSILDRYAKAIRERTVQFVIDDIRDGGTGESGIALEYRLYPYDTYLAGIETQHTAGIASIGRVALKMLGQWPTDAEVEITLDWGPRFPVDILSRLNQATTRVQLFGRLPEVIKREAVTEGYDQDQVKAIVDNVDRTAQAALQAQEANAQGGGLLGASRAEQMRAERQKAMQGGPAGGGA